MAAVLGFILGVLLSLIKIQQMQAPLSGLVTFYTSIFRGTPLLRYSSCIVHFGLPQLTGVTLTTMQSGVLTFS